MFSLFDMRLKLCDFFPIKMNVLPKQVKIAIHFTALAAGVGGKLFSASLQLKW